jgi:hypothetical protein
MGAPWGFAISGDFGGKKNLTEILHKVSFSAKGLRLIFTAAFALK